MRRITPQGFTLIEILLYAAIFVIVVGGMVTYAFAMLSSSQRADTQLEVADNARFMVQKLQRVLQGASSINTPIVGSSGASLSINTATASWNPFVIDVVSGSLRFKKGSAPAVPITNSMVNVSSISFKNYSFSTNTRNTIRLQAQVSSVDPYRPASSSIDIFISIQ